jgi:hypothetical protein
MTFGKHQNFVTDLVKFWVEMTLIHKLIKPLSFRYHIFNGHLFSAFDFVCVCVSLTQNIIKWFTPKIMTLYSIFILDIVLLWGKGS